MSWSRIVRLAFCLALVPGPLSAAEEEGQPQEALAPPAAYARSDAPLLHGRLELGLEDAIKMGLENNLGVEVARHDPVIAGYDESVAWGFYDPELFAEFGYTDSKTPNANALTGSGGEILGTTVRRSSDGFGGLRGQLPLLGTEYSAQFDSARTTTSISVQALVPELSSGWSLSLTQPVLKDLIWNQPWTEVRRRKLNFESSKQDFRTAVMETVRLIENAYWQLIANDEERRVARKSLETAQALLDQTKTQFEVGVVSRVEVTEAEAGLSRRETNLIVAENAYRNQQDVLIDLVLGPGLRADSTLEVDATDQPDQYVPYQIDVPVAVERAFQNRPELVAAEKAVERQEVELKFARNQRLPELDGIFSFGESGIAGEGNPEACGFVRDDPLTPEDEFADCLAAAANLDLGYGETFDGYSDNPVFTARARFSIPFPNTSARNTVSRTQIQLRKARTQKRRLEQEIIVEVRRAARNLEASQEAIDSARDAERAAQEQLRAERIRLEYGESTPFDVLQREEQLVDRENELIAALRGYRDSVTALDRAQGTILSNRNIKIEEVGVLR